MKKVIFILILISVALLTRAQISTGVGITFTKYRLTNGSNYNINQGVKFNLDLAYYFSENKGITTGLQSEPVSFTKEQITYTSDIFRIPLLYSTVNNFENTPFSFKTSGGYLLSVPFNSKTIGNVQNDIGIIHGVYVKSVLEAIVNPKARYYFGLEASYDFFNENNIKFIQVGMVCGLRVVF